jgi:hypothetical protein
MHRKNRKILKALVLGFAVAAISSPAALAEPRDPGNLDPLIADAIRSAQASPDDRSSYRGMPISQLDPLVADAIRASQLRSVSPDDRPLFRGVETANVADRVVVSTDSDGFQWVDAGVGAATTFGFGLLMGATALMVRQKRRRLATS